MSEFIFEIRLVESDLEGDEFWQDAIERDGTGISELTDVLRDLLKESALVHPETNLNEVLVLKSYTKK